MGLLCVAERHNLTRLVTYFTRSSIGNKVEQDDNVVASGVVCGQTS